jgi:hypothetical protein
MSLFAASSSACFFVHGRKLDSVSLACGLLDISFSSKGW